MKKLQFFTNGEVTTYVDKNADSSLEEETQLYSQGFVTVGDVVDSNNVSEALTLHKERYGQDVKELSVLGILAGLGTAL